MFENGKRHINFYSLFVQKRDLPIFPLIMQNVQYITDVEGHKTAVILPIEDYEKMLEDLHFGEVARESKDEPKRDFSAKIPQFCLK